MGEILTGHYAGRVVGAVALVLHGHGRGVALVAAHRIAAARDVPFCATIGHVPAGHHAARDRRQLREALVHYVDALVSRGQLLEAAQALAPGQHVLGPATVGEIVVDRIELLEPAWICWVVCVCKWERERWAL